MICSRCKQDSNNVETLTVRQRAVLNFMARGWTNERIAQAISFSHSTVRHDTMAIYRFFGVSNRHEAVEAARYAGFIKDQQPYKHQLPFWENE